MNYNILEPWKTLDEWQKEYINTEGNCFVLCGRQSGKSAAASIKAGKRAAEKPNRAIYILAYTEKQAYNLFFKALMYLKAAFPHMLVTRGRDKPTKHIITLKNKSQIFCYAVGLAGEGIRGPTATDIFVDEAAPMNKEVFAAILPMLSVTKGNFDIISTPRGTKDKDGEETYFYKCSKDDSFRKFYISAEDCPRHDKEFLKQQKQLLSEKEYAQEYLAKFLDDVQRVFSEETIKRICILKRRESVIRGRTYFLGCDVGRKKDPFTFEIIDATNSDRLEQVENLSNVYVSIPDNVQRIIALDEYYDFKKELIDSGGMGISVCDILRENDANKRKVVEINNASRAYREDGKDRTSKLMKEDLYETFIALIDRNKVFLLDDNDIKLSLASVQVEIENGKIRYFSSQAHIVEGIIRAVYGAQKYKNLSIWINSFKI